MNDAALRFLADESCGFGIIQALPAEGYAEVALTKIQNAFVVIQPGHIQVRRNK